MEGVLSFTSGWRGRAALATLSCAHLGARAGRDPRISSSVCCPTDRRGDFLPGQGKLRTKTGLANSGFSSPKTKLSSRSGVASHFRSF